MSSPLVSSAATSTGAVRLASVNAAKPMPFADKLDNEMLPMSAAATTAPPIKDEGNARKSRSGCDPSNVGTPPTSTFRNTFTSAGPQLGTVMLSVTPSPSTSATAPRPYAERGIADRERLRDEAELVPSSHIALGQFGTSQFTMGRSGVGSEFARRARPILNSEMPDPGRFCQTVSLHLSRLVIGFLSATVSGRWIL